MSRPSDPITTQWPHIGTSSCSLCLRGRCKVVPISLSLRDHLKVSQRDSWTTMWATYWSVLFLRWLKGQSATHQRSSWLHTRSHRRDNISLLVFVCFAATRCLCVVCVLNPLAASCLSPRPSQNHWSSSCWLSGTLSPTVLLFYSPQCSSQESTLDNKSRPSVGAPLTGPLSYIPNRRAALIAGCHRRCSRTEGPAGNVRLWFSNPAPRGRDVEALA